MPKVCTRSWAMAMLEEKEILNKEEAAGEGE
jgi:hypothetical protein